MPKKSDGKSGDKKTKSIRLSEKVWEALDKDAKRCFRDSTSQLEALLTKWFKLGDVEIHFGNEEASTDENQRNDLS